MYVTMYVSKKDCEERQKDIHAAGAEACQSYKPGLRTSSTGSVHAERKWQWPDSAWDTHYPVCSISFG